MNPVDKLHCDRHQLTMLCSLEGNVPEGSSVWSYWIHVCWWNKTWSTFLESRRPTTFKKRDPRQAPTCGGVQRVSERRAMVPSASKEWNQPTKIRF